MPAVRSLRRITPHVWIPPVYDPIFKIEIENSTTGVKIDITDDVIGGEYTDGVTETIGNFMFSLENSDQYYTDIINLNDQVNIYMDYATSATTLTFKGIIEKPNTSNNKLIISGRSTASKIMGIKVTKSYDNEYTHAIIEDLVSSYSSEIITLNNLDTTESTDKLVTVNWSQKSFWECIQDLCIRSGYGAYIDMDFDFNYFVSGTRLNTTEVIVHGNNLIDTGDFAPDISVLKNRVTVYGALIEDIQVFWTEEDSDSINQYGLKEERVDDSSLSTVALAKERAVYELAKLENPPIVGEVTGLGTPTLLPGQKIKISDPMNNLQPDYYLVQKFTHMFSNDEPMQTLITINKEINTIPTILKKRIIFETESPDTENPNEMKYSLVNTFSVNSGSHLNTQIVDGVLKTTTGNSTGTWISDTETIDSTNVNEIELRVNGDSIVGSNYYISTNGGITYTTITSLKTVISVPIGGSITFKVNLNSENAQLKAIGIYYNTE